MSVLYAAGLLVSIGCMVLIDARWRLFFFVAPWRAAVVLASGVCFFLAWDVVGIALGVFFRGVTPFLTGLVLAPELPVEEVLFLILLCYVSVNAYCGAERALAVRRGSANRGREEVEAP